MKVNSLKVYLPGGMFERKVAVGETFNVKIESDGVLVEENGRLTRYVGAPYSISYEKPAAMAEIDWM